MRELWHTISYKGKGDAQAVLAQVDIDAASLWFSGHFPNEPVLPGIAILSMVRDVIRRYASEKGKNVKISGIRRVRFRLPVRPGESLSISLSIPDHDHQCICPFKVVVHGDTACTGLMDVDRLPDKS